MIRKIHKIFLLTLLLSLASTLTFADEISATLEHTAGAGWASAVGNTPSVDGEQEYYNYDTPNGWAGVAFAKFSFEIPNGQTITSATLTWACRQYNAKKYASSIYFLNEGVDVDFANFASMDPLSNHRMDGQKTLIENHAALQGAKTTGKLHTGLTTDVTAAVQTINEAGQAYIIFQWTNNSGSAHLQGKASENAPVLTITTADASNSTSYTVKFVDASGNELKEPTVYPNVIIGDDATASETDMASFYNEDKTIKYMYESGNSTISLAKDENANIITLVFREAETWSYSVVDNFGKTLSSGSNLEGETVRVNFPRYILSNTQLYGYSEYSSSKKIFCFKDVTLTENNQVINIDYSEVADKQNILFLAEAEDIEGMTLSTAENSDIRCSNGKCGYNAGTEDLAITTLKPGKYVLSTSVWGNKTTTFGFKAGENEILSVDSKGYINDVSSEEFTIEEPTTIYLAPTNHAGRGIDFVYIQMTGVVEQEVTEQTSTLNFNESDYATSSSSSNEGDITEEKAIEVGDATLTVTPSNGKTPNRFWSTANGPQLRVYGGYLNVTVPEKRTITSVTINNAQWTATNTINGVASANSSWTGNSTNVLIGIAANTQINSITITTDVANEETATYVPTVNSIAAIKNLPVGQEIQFNMNGVKVTRWAGRSMALDSYIEDASGAMTADINISNTLMDLIPVDGSIDNGADVSMEGLLWATVTRNDKNIATLSLSEKTGTDTNIAFTQVEIEPTVVTLAQLIKDQNNKYSCMYVAVKNVNMLKDVDEWGNVTPSLTDGTDILLVYDNYWALPSNIPDYTIINSIAGFVGFDWDDNFAFMPYGEMDAVLAPAAVAENIGALKQLPNNESVRLMLKDAQIKVCAASRWGWGAPTVFIEDETGGIQIDGEMLVQMPGMFEEAGKVFNGELFCTYVDAYGSRSITFNETTTADSTKLEVTTAEVVPTEVTVAQALTAPYEGRFVKMTGLTFTHDDNDLYLVQGENSICIFDQFGCLPIDYETGDLLIGENIKSAEGLLLETEGVVYFLPYGDNAFVEEETPTAITDIQNGNSDSQTLFNLRGMKVQNTKGLKGLYIQNGKKVIFK